jgi:DDE superfamily endonuclease
MRPVPVQFGRWIRVRKNSSTLRMACLAGLPLPRAADGRLMLAVDVSSWLRPEAATSAGRLFCHVYGRGKGQAQMIPGWPYSVIAALEPGRTSWTAVLDAVRLGPGDDEAAVTAAQVRAVIARLIEAGHWQQGDPPILVIFDAGYDLTRLACLLAGLPAQILGRLRADRVLQQAAPPRQPHTRGRPRKHGGQLALADPATWPAPQVTTTTATSRYGTAMAAAWDKVHARLTHRAAWLEHEGPLPVIEGTLIRLQVDHLPGDRDPRPVWLWWSGTSALPAELDRCWQAYLRRFDLERSKPQCCHSRGWPASLLAPSSLVFMSAAWFFSQGRRLCWPRGSWCRVRSRAISAGPARTTVSLAWGCR